MKIFMTVVVIAVAGSATVVVAAPVGPQADTIAIPDGARGIGYDDIQYAPGAKRILVPAGRTGRLVLIDPATRAFT